MGSAAKGGLAEKEAERKVRAEPLAVYLHFPFCKSRCPYCDFFRKLMPRQFDEEALVQQYLADLAYFMPMCAGRKIKSVFFGGGTPSLLSAEAVKRVLDGLHQRFEFISDAEISLEANPNTFETEKFVAFKQAGINRLSLGVQALDEAGLKFLGRTHSLSDALNAMELGAKLFSKFSIDLIYARPQQTWNAWQQEIDRALAFGLKHISLYQLTLEEGTVFARKNIQLPDEEESLTLYNNTVSYLRSRGFDRYEVSNFALGADNRSIHNLVYWQGGDYIGLGTGAHGRLQSQGKILATVDGRIAETLSPEERAEELVIMGLRIEGGINAEAFYQACGLKLFDFLSEKMTKIVTQSGFLVYDNASIRLTDKGFLVLDEVIRMLLA